MGFDEFAVCGESFNKTEFELVKNFGKGKCFPGGPECEFNGKKVSMLSQWSDSGGITPQILTNALKLMDNLDLFPREEGRIPFLLLDAHGSRFSQEFVRYINDPAHRWCVCIGVPYGTSLWQVADSEEQNGTFTIVFADAKQDLLKRKWETGISHDLNRHNIIPCLNIAFAQSFANITTNKKAINARGWGIALNQELLDNVTLLNRMSDEDKQREITEPWGRPKHGSQSHNAVQEPPSASTPASPFPSISPADLNLYEGLAGNVLDNIVQYRDSLCFRSKLKKRKNKHINILQAFKATKKAFLLSGGRCIEHNKWRLDNDILSIIEAKELTKNNTTLVKKKHVDHLGTCRNILYIVVCVTQCTYVTNIIHLHCLG